MRTAVVGIGAGGHAKVLIDILQLMGGFKITGLTDSRAELRGKSLNGIPVLGSDELLCDLFRGGTESAFLGVGGVGNNHPRAEIFERVRRIGFEFINALHPSASIARSVVMETGVAIMAGAVVNPDAHVGCNVVINSGAVVEHDCVLGDHVHVGPGAALAAAVKVGRYSHIGLHAAIKQGVSVGEDVVVGAGAVVLHDVPAGDVVLGVPARAKGDRRS
jgi:sugar O-acyltransferase (sialic acid O-acetyltransferase NeuD family)